MPVIFCRQKQWRYYFQEVWKQQVTGAKLRETSEEARSYAMGNKSLAALFVHSPAGELQRQIRSWLAESFDFLSLTGEGGGGGNGGSTLEALATAIMDGWMAGLGVPQRPSTDALGQLLSDYTKRVYTSQLQHLKVQYYPPVENTKQSAFKSERSESNEELGWVEFAEEARWIFRMWQQHWQPRRLKTLRRFPNCVELLSQWSTKDERLLVSDLFVFHQSLCRTEICIHQDHVML